MEHFNSFCDRKPLYELSGKTVAVDLSCWICEAQNIAEYQVQPRMYLRNLYFRTCFLLLMEVTPVFVLEGKAPELKYDTIAARNEIQFKGAKPKTDGVKTGKGRTRFNFVLKQCEEMLRHMGLACITGCGEAESLCAYLNDEGLVDGCISQDSDCFAYGAKIVYRNFSISTQGAYAASGGAVDIYDINKAKQSLNFGRNKIIAMALLCGSDYSEGVSGIGKESVMKLFEKLTDEETLERIRSWRKEPELYQKFEDRISDKNICTSCGHYGKLQAHTKNGCNQCSTTKGCDPFKFKEERLTIKNELNMRNKALQDPQFPNEKLISEYLEKKDNVAKLNLTWRQPDVVAFVKFTNKFLGWEEIYAFEKILPILTRWQCLNSGIYPSQIKTQKNIKGVLIPDYIKKARNPKGIPSYLIVWKDEGEHFKGLIPEEQLLERNIAPEKLWSTVEPKLLVENAYPELVAVFENSKLKPKKKKKGTSEPPTKKIRKEKKKKGACNDESNKNDEFKINKPQKKQAGLHNFLKIAVINSQKQNVVALGEEELKTSTPLKNVHENSTLNTDLSSFGDENDLDISDIVVDIISKKPDYMLGAINNVEISVDGDIDNSEVMVANSSSFFITEPVENDLFERTFNDMLNKSDDNEESDENINKLSTEDEPVIIVDCDDDDGIVDESPAVDNESSSKDADDSFDIVCEPLLERLKRRMK